MFCTVRGKKKVAYFLGDNESTPACILIKIIIDVRLGIKCVYRSNDMIRLINARMSVNIITSCGANGPQARLDHVHQLPYISRKIGVCAAQLPRNIYSR